MSHQLPELPTEVKQFINNTPMVQSLLYNLNLLPELIEQSSDMQKMLTIVEHMKAFSELIPIASVKREPLSDPYIQIVPDKCDRIVWRNRYYHLSIAGAQNHTKVTGSPASIGTMVVLESPWQCVSVAPYNKNVIVWREDSGPFIAKLIAPYDTDAIEGDDETPVWLSEQYGLHDGNETPTHWMPLPPPPVMDSLTTGSSDKGAE